MDDADVVIRPSFDELVRVDPEESLGQVTRIVVFCCDNQETRFRTRPDSSSSKLISRITETKSWKPMIDDLSVLAVQDC